MSKELQSKIENILERDFKEGDVKSHLRAEIELTDKEKELFKKMDCFDDNKYWWELNKNKLYIVKKIK